MSDISNLPLFVTIIVCIAALYNCKVAWDNEVSKVYSGIDNKPYVVLNLPDKEAAADELARLRIKMNGFIKLLQSKALEKNKLKATERLDRVQRKFRSVLSESKPGSKYTSYTVNKGDKIVMCIRERDENNRLIDENTLFFVALHELAHVMTLSIGHTEEFWDNFRFLLKNAIKYKYYIYHPYHVSPKKYCSTYISNTPLKI